MHIRKSYVKQFFESWGGTWPSRGSYRVYGAITGSMCHLREGRATIWKSLLFCQCKLIWSDNKINCETFLWVHSPEVFLDLFSGSSVALLTHSSCICNSAIPPPPPPKGALLLLHLPFLINVFIVLFLILFFVCVCSGEPRHIDPIGRNCHVDPVTATRYPHFTPFREKSPYVALTWKYDSGVPLYFGKPSYEALIPFSTKPHQNAFWYNNSWLGFQKILNYVPKERENFSA